MEAVIFVLLATLLLIVISLCVVVFLLAQVIKENSEKTTYLLSQLMYKEGYPYGDTVDEMNTEIDGTLRKKEKPFNPHTTLTEHEEYDE